MHCNNWTYGLNDGHLTGKASTILEFYELPRRTAKNSGQKHAASDCNRAISTIE